MVLCYITPDVILSDETITATSTSTTTTTGDETTDIECVNNEYSESCNCDGPVGIFKTTCVPGSNLHPDDIYISKFGEDCSAECPVWTAWGEWTPYFPSCVDELDTDNPDTIFNDLEKHMPKRIRERECKFGNGTTTPANHVSGNCPFSDKMETERQTVDNYTKCVSVFEEVEIDDEVEIETKVIVDFQVEIYEEWTEELEDPKSDAFTDLAEIYILGFLESLQAISDVDGTSQIQFATVRVIRFELIEEDFVAFRRKRSIPQDKIRAVFETVYDIIAPKDEAKETNIVEDSQQQINIDIAEQVVDQVRTTVEEKIVEAPEDHQPGELNFLRVPEARDIISVNYEEKVLASYSDYVVLDCDCATGKTLDHHECVATAQDVSLFP